MEGDLISICIEGSVASAGLGAACMDDPCIEACIGQGQGQPLFGQHPYHPILH